MWKFPVQHAPKAVGQWEFITGIATAVMQRLRTIQESKKQKAFYLQLVLLQCNGQKFMPMVMSCQNPKGTYVGHAVSILQTETVCNKLYTLM